MPLPEDMKQTIDKVLREEIEKFGATVRSTEDVEKRRILGIRIQGLKSALKHLDEDDNLLFVEAELATIQSFYLTKWHEIQDLRNAVRLVIESRPQVTDPEKVALGPSDAGTK